MQNLATMFRHMARGMEAVDLSPVQFYEMQESALNGEVTAEELTRLVTEDFRNGEDWQAAATTIFEALLADAARPQPS